MRRFWRQEMVTGHGLNSRVSFQKIQKNLVVERGVEMSAIKRRQSIAKIPFQNGIDCAPSILEDVIVQDHMAWSFFAVAFYPGKHFAPLRWRSRTTWPGR